MTVEPLSVLIADDHPVFRRGLKALLASMDGVELIGEATDGATAISMAEELQPDLILMDLQMPAGGGLAATRSIARTSPNIRILVVTMFEDDDSVFAAMRAGARGYVLKDAPTDELVGAIETVHSGEAYFSGPVAKIALNQYVADADESRPVAKLSDREREVLALIAEGKSNKEIAMHLGIGVRTTETHRERIMRKLDIHSVAGLTKFAIANGISSLEEGEKK